MPKIKKLEELDQKLLSKKTSKLNNSEGLIIHTHQKDKNKKIHLSIFEEKIIDDIAESDENLKKE